MRTPRKVFIKQLATSLGAAAFMLRGAAQRQETLCPLARPGTHGRGEIRGRGWLRLIEASH